MREWIFFEKFFHRKFAYLLGLAQRIAQLFRKTHTNAAYAAWPSRVGEIRIFPPP